jgi:hypothetical protein
MNVLGLISQLIIIETLRLTWPILLVEFDLTYVAKNIIKGRIIVEHCAGHPVSEDSVNDDFLDKDILSIDEKATWKMYFDGASN